MSESRAIEGRMACGRELYVPSPHGHALPGDQPVWPRDRAAQIKHIKLEVALDVEARAVAGTATHTVVPFNDRARNVSFDAVDLRIEAVSVAGAKAKHSYDGRTLTVDLGAERKRGEEIDVAIVYRATPRIGLYFIGPDEGYPDKPRQVWSQNQDEDSRYWYPCFDHPNNKQTSEMIATVPGTWFALSNGTLVRERANKDGTRTFHWRQDRPHSTYLITLAAGEFTRTDAGRDGLAIDWYVEAGREEAGQLTFRRTPEMIALFERLSGVKYPWAKYSQVVVRDFVFGGMENTSATTMTENILLDRKAARDFTTEDLVSHELAHMWWGDLLTCRDWSHGWLNEGFATYFELLWTHEVRGIDEYRMGVIVDTDLYMGERYRRPIVSNVFNEPIDVFDRHLYEKGSLVLHTLRGVLGDDAFFRSIQRYCRDNQDRNVVTQDLVDAIEAETGRNMEWFFEQWVYRPGHPELKVSWSWDEVSKLATVSVKQTQKIETGTPVFRLPVTIDFTTGRGRPRAFAVEVTEAEQRFVFPLPEKPDLCRFDPYNRVLKTIEFEKSVGELRLQLRDDDDIAGRRQAAEGLGKKGGAEAIAALEDAVTNDRFWGVSAAAAKALGEIRTTAARDALQRQIGARHHKVRRAVVAALGEFHGDETVFEALKPLSRKDQSWFVESEANRSIGKLRVAGAFDVLCENIERRSFREIVRAGCIDGLVELRDERGFDVLVAAAKYGAPWQPRGLATGAIARLGTHFPERKKPLGEMVEPFLRDPDFRVRIAAANALKTLEEPSFAGLLDDMARRELDGRGVRAAREAAAALRKGADQPEELKNLREEFEKLRDENGKLRERLDKLEAQTKKG